MNVKLRVLSAGVLFFMGGQALAQKVKKDSIKDIEEVIVQGYKTVSKKTAVISSATVKSETIENRPNANVMNIVQGQLAGVNITANTGQPGAKSTVIIRGVGTFNGNTDPLYVIDGFPSNSDNFRSINSNDIESLEVLKDASAISQYGNRGSNGVIIVKTKRGSYGSRFSVRYQGQFGVSMLQTPKYSFSNAKELLTIENIFGVGKGASMTSNDIANYNVDTDWVKYFFRPAVSTSHNVSITTGGKNITSFTSLGYFEQDGLLKTTGLKRFTVRNNIDGKSDDERFKYSLSSAVGFSKNNEATSLGTGAVNRNYVLGAYQSAPYVSPNTYQNSIQLFNLYQTDGTLLYTPLFLIDKLNNYNNITDETRIDVTAEVSYKILTDLTARIRSSGELLSTRFEQAEFPDSFNGILFSNTPGVASSQGGAFNGFEDINQRREFLFSNLVQLDYTKRLGDHTFSFLGNMEYNHSRVQTNNFRQRGLNPKTFVPDTGAGYVIDTSANDFYVPQVSASKLLLNMVSYFGSFDYDYNKKYGFVATIRRDGTSRFYNGSQWGTFWSLGGRWNIDEEKFMDNINFVDVLKLRGSIGTVGNQRYIDGTIYSGIIPPGYRDIYSLTNNTYNGGQGYAISFGDTGLKWEITKTYNIGLDFELFSKRLRGSFDHYNKKTIDMYMTEPTAPALGTLSISRNTSANMVNKGFEAGIAYDLIKNKVNQMTLTIRANGSINNQKINDIPLIGGKISVGTDPTIVSQNGYMIELPFVYHYIGVNPANGNLLFEDINGNPTENPTSADRKLYKYSSIPKYQGGFGFDFDYKGFYASTTFTFVAGVARYDYDLSNLYDPDNLGQFNVSSDLLNAWTPTNTNTDVPSLTAANKAFDVNSDRFLKDASYIRLRNAQLGYRLPKSLLAGTFIKDLSIFVQGENLYNWTKWQGYDPESDRGADQTQYPTPKIFTLGFDVKF